MIAGHENGRAPEGAPTVTTQRASAAIATEKPNQGQASDATPYTDENDPTDEEALPLSYDDRRDWYTRGQYSADCAPDVPPVTGQPDHGYFVDSELEDAARVGEAGDIIIVGQRDVPRVGDPCVSCIGKTRVAGCMCVTDARTAYLALPQELVPQYPPLPTWKIQHALRKAFAGTPLLRTVAQGPTPGDTISTCAWGECGREYVQKNGWGVFCSRACGIAEMSA